MALALLVFEALVPYVWDAHPLFDGDVAEVSFEVGELVACLGPLRPCLFQGLEELLFSPGREGWRGGEREKKDKFVVWNINLPSLEAEKRRRVRKKYEGKNSAGGITYTYIHTRTYLRFRRASMRSSIAW